MSGLVEEGGQQGFVVRRREDCGQERGSVGATKSVPGGSNGGAPVEEMFCPNLAQAAEGAGPIGAAWPGSWCA